MMTKPFFDHHRDAAAKGMIDILYGGGAGSVQRVDAATDMQQGDIIGCQTTQ